MARYSQADEAARDAEQAGFERRCADIFEAMAGAAADLNEAQTPFALAEFLRRYRAAMALLPIPAITDAGWDELRRSMYFAALDADCPGMPFDQAAAVARLRKLAGMNDDAGAFQVETERRTAA